MIRLIFIIAGTFFLILGIIGIVVPGLPTTPFLLLTAGLYVRSSDRLYQKLVRNKYVGTYISQWQENRTLTGKTKLVSLALMWTMILISAFLEADKLILQIVMVFIGIIGTLVMGFLIPTTKK